MIDIIIGRSLARCIAMYNFHRTIISRITLHTGHRWLKQTQLSYANFVHLQQVCVLCRCCVRARSVFNYCACCCCCCKFNATKLIILVCERAKSISSLECPQLLYEYECCTDQPISIRASRFAMRFDDNDNDNNNKKCHLQSHQIRLRLLNCMQTNQDLASCRFFRTSLKNPHFGIAGGLSVFLQCQLASL